MLGKPIGELIIPPSLREQHRRGMAHYLATGDGPLLALAIVLAVLALLLLHGQPRVAQLFGIASALLIVLLAVRGITRRRRPQAIRSEEHTSELQSH